jgi:hypothetical protein
MSMRPWRTRSSRTIYMVDTGEIVDSMTIIAVLQAERRRAGG